MQVDLQNNLVTITPSLRIAPDLRAIPAAVRQSGYRPGRMWLVAEGRSETLPNGQPGYRIAGWPEPLRCAVPMASLELRAEVSEADGAVLLR